MFQRQADGLVDAPDRQHAHRAAGTVDHVHRGRQQVRQAVARYGVGMSAAELHQAIASVIPGFPGYGARQVARQRAVAEFIEVLHAIASDAGFIPANNASVRSASSTSSFCSAKPTCTMT